MITGRTSAWVLLAAAMWAWGGSARAQLPVAKTFQPPGLTTWTPSGCRAAPAELPALPGRFAWRNLHGDTSCSDEVSVALAPVFGPQWTTEAATFNPTGPVFDSAGHLYFSPLVPYENVVLISLDPHDGSRRWAIAGTGAPPGGSAPMVLADPSTPGAEIVYLALYDRAIAVRTDGTVVWDVPTGLTLSGLASPFDGIVMGTNYVPADDAIAGLTHDGQIFLLDRTTGAPLLATPYQLPGAPSPTVPSTVPPAILQAAETLFRQFVNTPPGSLANVIGTLQGNGVKVANMFAVDPRSSRLWVIATAPDGEDGTIDGVSQLGALYGLDVVASGSGHTVSEVCHRSFTGGSATTPTVSADGGRVYVGDNVGNLIAIDPSCQDVWTLGVGAQIIGSVGGASDKHEIYAATRNGIVKVVDQGGGGQIVWTANLDVFDLAAGQSDLNMDLVAVAANGLAFQAAAGVILNNVPLPSIVGTGVLDRETGAVRYFAGGGEETVAVMSTGPDGAVYIGNSPIRRLFAYVLNLSSAPLTGGITKFAPQRLDLLARDAVCAAAARARNAWPQTLCPEAVQADAVQIGELIAQTRAAGAQAVTDGDLKPLHWHRLEQRLSRAEPAVEIAVGDGTMGRVLRQAAQRLDRVCRRLNR